VWQSRSIGCAAGQGCCVSRPIDLAAAVALLAPTQNPAEAPLAGDGLPIPAAHGQVSVGADQD
jgi:hypothetical protein